MEAALGRDSGVSTSQQYLSRIVRNISPASSYNTYDVNLTRYHAEDLKQTYLKSWANIFDWPVSDHSGGGVNPAAVVVGLNPVADFEFGIELRGKLFPVKQQVQLQC